jgi:hypothetical protein
MIPEGVQTVLGHKKNLKKISKKKFGELKT